MTKKSKTSSIPKFKVGDKVVFTDKTPNHQYRGVMGVILTVDKDEIRIRLKNHPTRKDAWIETLHFGNVNLIRHANKLEQVLK